MKIVLRVLAAAGLVALACVPASAQQVTGIPGSPGATTTIDEKLLPAGLSLIQEEK
jgi:arylsulfatase